MTGANPPRELRLSIPARHRCFADHFPGAPLLPGALLLKWLMVQLTEAGYQRVNYLKQVKFLAPVLPGDDLRICITPGPSAQTIGATIYKGETLILKGQFGCIYD